LMAFLRFLMHIVLRRAAGLSYPGTDGTRFDNYDSGDDGSAS
jgi:hypothetical protein